VCCVCYIFNHRHRRRRHRDLISDRRPISRHRHRRHDCFTVSPHLIISSFARPSVVSLGFRSMLVLRGGGEGLIFCLGLGRIGCWLAGSVVFFPSVSPSYYPPPLLHFFFLSGAGSPLLCVEVFQLILLVACLLGVSFSAATSPRDNLFPCVNVSALSQLLSHRVLWALRHNTKNLRLFSLQ